jgi:hypothetical protein
MVKLLKVKLYQVSGYWSIADGICIQAFFKTARNKELAKRLI